MQKPFYQRRGCLISLIIVGLFLTIGLVNAIATGGKGIGNTDVTPTPTTQSATQAPTKPPTPTPTPKPLSETQRAIQLAQNTSLFGKQIKASVNGQELDMSEYIDTNGFFNNGSILTAIKSDCFNILQAEYSGLKGLSSVDLKINAPLQDKYGNASTGLMAECTLQRDTEVQFNWGNLDYSSAWGDYDYTWTLPSLGS